MPQQQESSPLAAGAAGGRGGRGTLRGLLFLQRKDAGLDRFLQDEFRHLRYT